MNIPAFISSLDPAARSLFQFGLELRATDNQPAEVTTSQILEGLYLGSMGAAYSKEVLERLGISYILTVAENLPPMFPNDFIYKVIEVTDFPSTNIAQHFSECFQFINHALCEKRKVLVHCLAGISRSPSVVIAYLMYYKQMPLIKALEYVKARRHWANPNSGFMNQLRRLDSHLASLPQQ